MDETDDDMLWNGCKEDGSVRSECEGDEDTDCEDGDVTLIGERRYLTCFVHYVYDINSNIVS